MSNLVYVGYITGTFGIKGEVKILCETIQDEKVFKVGNLFYIDDKSFKVKNIHFHKNAYLTTFEGYEDINKVDFLLKKEVFVNRDDIGLLDNEYLTIELKGLTIIEKDDKTIGKVEEILYNKNNLFIKSGSLIIPMIDKYVKEVNVKKGFVKVQDVGELRL